ncbi:hypothetical protein ACH47B_26170 [Rhodococcus sp. NPDC019627]|uniref:hypothetical protein n=1 Tax=unclassified Rhodococcus (in: high G+C Gram-positive bacteria) TaxID=192944 RepID=UPI0033D1EDC9
MAHSHRSAMSTDYFPGLRMSVDHHGQHSVDGELALDATETTILDTFIRALVLHSLAGTEPAGHPKEPS